MTIVPYLCLVSAQKQSFPVPYFPVFALSPEIWNCLKMESVRVHENNRAGIFLLIDNNENTRTICEICSKLIFKTPERRH